MIEHFKKLPTEEIVALRQSGRSDIIPYELQQYILQLDRSVELYRVDGNISRVAKKLIEEFPHLDQSLSTARSRIYDAINLFYLNNTVKNLAWNMYYADKFEDLAKLALAADNITEARRCFDKAHQLKTAHDEAAYDPDKLKPVEVLVGPEYGHERLGITKHNKKTLWKDIVDFIDDPEKNYSEEDKLRLKNEAALAIGIETIDVNHEDS